MDGSTLTAASRQWATRPNDERFVSLIDLDQHAKMMRAQSQSRVIANRQIEARAENREDLLIEADGTEGMLSPSHFAFGQLATLAGAPAGYLRKLPAPMAADCINYGLTFERDVEEIGFMSMLPPDGTPMLRAATGPNYGRIWNADITGALCDRFGDGITGDWRVPGEFGKQVQITKANTTLYAGDRDMFVFLADEDRRIEIPNRRAGEPGSFARGFFVWNSEVGSTTMGAAFFLFDFVCKNRIVWGARDYREVRIRHTKGAPHRWLEEVTPALEAYSQASAAPIIDQIEAARQAKIEKLDEFLAKRQFTRAQISAAKQAHLAEEGRQIETIWDAVTGLTASAKQIGVQDDRVQIERKAGALLDLV